MRKITLLTALLFLISFHSFCQLSLTSPDDKNNVSIGGLFSAFYNQRLQKPGYVNNKHDEFGLRDMVFDIYGKTTYKFSYELKVDFANLLADAASGGIVSPDNPGFRSGFVKYSGFPVHIKLGWDKVPFSQSSITDIYESPFWQRDLLTGGDMFSRRDMGLTLSSPLWSERINLYAGAYSGLGEYFIGNGDNDASGQPEYIGRADFSFPEKYDYKSVDINGSKKFRIRVGADVRYTNKTQPGSYNLSSKLMGAYGLNAVDGKKTAYGFDASAEYKHLSLQVEHDRIMLQPADQTNALFHGTQESFNKGKIFAGGWVTTLNYHCKAIKSVFSAKYDQENVNDLADGKQEYLHVAYAYLVNGWHSCLKFEWTRPLTEDKASDPINYTNNFRIGLQVLFDNENFSR